MPLASLGEKWSSRVRNVSKLAGLSRKHVSGTTSIVYNRSLRGH